MEWLLLSLSDEGINHHTSNNYPTINIVVGVHEDVKIPLS